MRRWNFGRWDWIGVACVALFVVAYGVQRTRHAAPANRPGGGQPGEVRLGHEWMGLHHEGRRVGLVHLEKQALGAGYRFILDTEMRLQAMGADASMALHVTADLDAELALQRFEFGVDAGPARFAGEGAVTGTQIALTLKTGGVSSTRTIDLPEPPILRANMGALLSREALVPGAVLRFHAFDPLTQQNQAVEVEVVGPDELVVMGQLVAVTHVRQRINGLVLDGWMNAQGEMLRQELGLGLVALRETEEEARWGLRSEGAAPDLMRATMIDAPGLPESLSRATVLRLKFGGAAAPEVLEMAVDGRQALEDGWLVVRREAVGPGLALPVSGAEAEDLAATVLVQSDHPDIVAAAREAAGGAADTVDAARRISAWLATNLAQRPVPGVPSALETLQSKVGDCNEHAALFAAMARALGVPTRVVVGVVYQGGPTGGRFGYHAWNEVQVQDGWLSVDATWRQLPADAGHVRLVRGGLDAQLALIRVIGRLSILEAKAL